MCKSFSCYCPGIQALSEFIPIFICGYIHTPPTLVLPPANPEADFVGLHHRLMFHGLIPTSDITHVKAFSGRASVQGSLTVSCLQFTRWQSVWRHWASLWWRPGGRWRAMEIKFSVWTGAKTKEELWALPRYAVGQMFSEILLSANTNLLAVLHTTLFRWHLCIV